MPLLVGVGFFFFGWLFEGEQAALSSLAVLASLVTLAGQVAIGAGLIMGNTPSVRLFTWSPLPNAQVQVAFRADQLSYYFALLVTVLVFIICIYLVARQPSAESGEGITGGRLYGLMLLTEGAALAAFYSSDLIWMYGWGEVVGLCLYLLAGPGLRGASSEPASFQAYAVSVFGGFLILAPLLVAVSRNGGISLYTSVSPSSFEAIFFALITAGGLVKAAQFPFHPWSGAVGKLPAGAYAFIAAGAIFPLAIYIPARVQNIVGSRFNYYNDFAPALLPAGAITALVCAWLAVRESNLTGKVAYVTAGQFGFILIALGLQDFLAASWQIFALVLAAPLLWLCSDLMQIEIIPLIKAPGSRVAPPPLKRPAHYRGALISLYLVGVVSLICLPFTPGYAGRWETLGGLLSGNYRFYFGLAVLSLAVTLAALAQGLLAFLGEQRQTVDGSNRASWISLSIPGLLALATLVFGFDPAPAAEWVGQFTAGVNPGGLQKLPAEVFTGGSWFGLVGAAGLLLLFIIFMAASRVAVAPAFNGGMLYGAEAEEYKKERASRKKAIQMFEEKLPSGFDDDFFKIGTAATTQTTYTSTGPEPRLPAGEYFSGLGGRLRYFYRALDTGFSGGWLGGIILRVLGFLVWVLEWMTERFYAALAALIVLLFIVVLITR